MAQIEMLDYIIMALYTLKIMCIKIIQESKIFSLMFWTEVFLQIDHITCTGPLVPKIICL